MSQLISSCFIKMCPWPLWASCEIWAGLISNDKMILSSCLISNQLRQSFVDWPLVPVFQQSSNKHLFNTKSCYELRSTFLSHFNWNQIWQSLKLAISLASKLIGKYLSVYFQHSTIFSCYGIIFTTKYNALYLSLHI